MARRGRVAAWLLMIACASALYAKPGIVKTRDGLTYEGDVDETKPQQVTVTTVRGIPAVIPRDHIASISYDLPNSKQQLTDRLAKLQKNDVNGRIQLARDAFEAHEYLLARDAVESALQLDPNNADAVQLRDTIQNQIRLERTRQRPASGPDETHVPATTTPTTEPTQIGDQKVLRPSEINAIRLAEMRPDDQGVRIRFLNNVQKRYADFRGGSPANFYALNPMQQAQEILQRGPVEMRKDIIVQNDPPALLQYRRNVQPFVVQNCATTGCHANSNTHFNMVLPTESDAATYTNFYLLTHYTQPMKQQADMVFGHGEPKMVDRQSPGRSLLLQYALPGSMTEMHHPDVPNFRPPLRGVNDPRYVTLNNWIGQSLQPVDPDYGFTFGGAATMPSTEPATMPATAPAAPPPHPVSRPVHPPAAKAPAPR